MPKRVQTTDGRYVRVAEGEWWDTTGIDIVPEAIVDAYMEANGVGLAVIGNGHEDDETDPAGHAPTLARPSVH